MKVRNVNSFHVPDSITEVNIRKPAIRISTNLMTATCCILTSYQHKQISKISPMLQQLIHSNTDFYWVSLCLQCVYQGQDPSSVIAVLQSRLVPIQFVYHSICPTSIDVQLPFHDHSYTWIPFLFPKLTVPNFQYFN